MFPERASNFAVDPAWANMGLQCYICGILLRHRLLRVDYYHDGVFQQARPALTSTVRLFTAAGSQLTLPSASPDNTNILR